MVATLKPQNLTALLSVVKKQNNNKQDVVKNTSDAVDDKVHRLNRLSINVILDKTRTREKMMIHKAYGNSRDDRRTKPIWRSAFKTIDLDPGVYTVADILKWERSKTMKNTRSKSVDDYYYNNLTKEELNKLDPLTHYKDAAYLSHFIGITGGILPITSTGLTQRNQKRLTQAVHRARCLCIIPTTYNWMSKPF